MLFGMTRSIIVKNIPTFPGASHWQIVQNIYNFPGEIGEIAESSYCHLD